MIITLCPTIFTTDPLDTAGISKPNLAIYMLMVVILYLKNMVCGNGVGFLVEFELFHFVGCASVCIS